ncbi:MAG: amidase [Jatrophihabitans sp.]|nr:amidase [Jatrophihabitans sp.]
MVAAVFLTVSPVGAGAVPGHSATPAGGRSYGYGPPPGPARDNYGGFAIDEASIPEIQDAILHHKVTFTQVVDDYLQRIKAYNGTCVSQPNGPLGHVEMIPNAGKVNALMTLNLRPATRAAWGFSDHYARSQTDAVDNNPSMPDALQTAAKEDAAFARTGKLSGPLAGVVFAIKDQYSTRDMRTTSGAIVNYANDRPPTDATVVARLRAAGAIILAKANMDEYAGGPARSSYGGTECNPYATDRDPGGSSGGSGVSVATNMVTCAIGEETGGSIVKPSFYNDVVGTVPTRQLVSASGMIQSGLSTRVGPICKSVSDDARVLSVYKGYDPKDELTAFSMGRDSGQPYTTKSNSKSMPLAGYRIGVIREYMDKSLFSVDDVQDIDLADKAVNVLKQLGATIVDPGEHGALFQSCVDQYVPKTLNQQFVPQFPASFPAGSDQNSTLVAMGQNSALVPHTASGGPTIRNIPATSTDAGDTKYMMNTYLAQRGDARIHNLTDLLANSTFWNDPNREMPNRQSSLVSANKATTLATASALQTQNTWQTVIYNCFAKDHLDAVISPTGNNPPVVLTAPAEPTVNDRGQVWDGISSKGFPAISIPDGFSTTAYDTDEAGNRLPGVAVKLPAAVQLIALPFQEQTLFDIGAAYQNATKARRMPAEFGPLSH